jgi:hypothetical protein
MKVSPEWLTQRVENAPIALQKLKAEEREGDELWAFENPSNTWKKLGRHNGYALVRKGKIIRSTIVTSV